MNVKDVGRLISCAMADAELQNLKTAKDLGTSHTTISHWRCQRAYPSIQLFRRFIAYLAQKDHLTAQWLLYELFGVDMEPAKAVSPVDFDKLFNDGIKKTGLSKYRLASFIGVSESSVYRWSNGSAPPCIYHVKQIAIAFDKRSDGLGRDFLLKLFEEYNA